MLDYAKKHKNVKHIIFDILDRMTRNDFDKIKIKELIERYGKIVHFSRTNKTYSISSSPDDEFMMDIEVAVAKKMSNDISRKTRMGMQEKASQGIFPSNSPLGYLNNKITGKIDVDPVRAPLIQELFQKVASGRYSISMLREELAAKGLRHKTRNSELRKNTLYKLIYNPIYYGVFRWGGKLYKGRHTPLISKELWDMAIKELGNLHRPNNAKKKYAFSGLFTCGTCKMSVIGERAKGKYTYYRCSFFRGHHKHEGYKF
jgi:DNA invertase Pin-like site-specific DNA recombinase